MQKNNKRCNKGHKQDKDPNKSDLVHFLPKSEVQQFLQTQIQYLQKE